MPGLTALQHDNLQLRGSIQTASVHPTFTTEAALSPSAVTTTVCVISYIATAAFAKHCPYLRAHPAEPSALKQILSQGLSVKARAELLSFISTFLLHLPRLFSKTLFHNKWSRNYSGHQLT